MKERISRRDFLRLGAATAASAVLASCAPKAAAPGGGDTAAPAQLTKEQVTLRLWHWDNFIAQPWEKEAVRFTETNPNVKIAVEMTPYGEYSQKVSAAIAGGTPPDVTGTIAEHFTNMAGQGQLTNLRPYIARDKYDIDDFHPGNLSQNSWGGNLLSIPYTADGMWWFYQVDEFKKRGLKTPYEYWKDGNWTWDTAMELSKELTTGEGTDKYFGCGGVQYGNYFEILPYVASNGGDIFDPEYTKCILSEEAASAAYKWAYNMRQYSPGPEDAQAGTPQSGRVMQWLDWSPFYQVYLDQMPFKYSVAPPPAAPKSKQLVFCGDAPGFGILKNVKNPDWSWEYIKFLMSRETLLAVFLATNTEPPRLSMVKTADIWKQNTALPEPEIAFELTAVRFKEGFFNPPKASNFSEMWQAHNEELSLVWADEKSLEEGLNTVAERITALLQEGQVDKDRLHWTSK